MTLKALSIKVCPIAARTISVEPEKEAPSPRRHVVVVGHVSGHVSGHGTENLYSNGNNLSRSESSSSDSVNSQDGHIQVKSTIKNIYHK